MKSDKLFADLFNKNEMLTLEFVASQILECDPQEIHGKVTIENRELIRVDAKEKRKYVDLKIQYKAETIIVEMNNNYKGNYTRNLVYAMNAVLDNFNMDDPSYYKKVARVILVNLNWFYDGNTKGEPAKSVEELSYPVYGQDGYILKIINICLDYYATLCYDKIGCWDKLYKLLTINNKKELNEFTKQEKLLKNYSKKIIDLSNNESYRRDIMNERIEDNLLRHEGYFEGLEEGVAKNQREMIINMYNKKYSFEEISEIVNLNVEKIKEIIEEQENN